MFKREEGALPLEDWLVWVALRDARLSPAGLRAIRSLLAEKESQVREPPPDTPLVALTLDEDTA
jgi:hypothetical protein